MNYALWDGLVRHGRWRGIRRAIDAIDTVTLNMRMWHCLAAELPQTPIDPAMVPESVVDPDFFSKLDLRADAAEFRLYDRYTTTIAITAHEKAAFERATSRTTVVHIPMTQQVKHVANTYAGRPLFATGPNPFNIQGYLFFVKRVLPRVLERQEDFSLDVTGSCCESVTAVPGIALSGYVPDLSSVYEQAPFAICPVFGLTGQQVKIVEAMAHGVPVIALKAAADRSPIEHEVNGLVAHDASEFAEYVLRLWADRALCRRFGQAAKECIEQHFSPEQLRRAVSSILA